MSSESLHEQASKIIPGGVNSPVRAMKHVGASPLYFERAEGAKLFDVDGKSYVDFCLSFGPHILGHSHPKVVAAIKEQADKATSFGACHPKEVELVRLILDGYPFLDKVRLVNSGTEAVMTAIRLARGFTGRSKIVAFEGCYHGHSDGLLAKAGSGVAALSESSSKGVPASVVADTLIARLDRLETLDALFESHGSDIAVVVLEAIPANYGLWVAKRADLERIVSTARKHGALVLFDEVITGFRLGPSGASGYFDMRPDLVTLGKVIGGGLPLAAVAGRAEIMDRLAPLGDVYQAGTLSGNPLATAAGIAVLETLAKEPPFAAFEFGCTAFVEGLKGILEKEGSVSIRHVGSLFWIRFGEDDGRFPPALTKEEISRYAAFFRRALAAGVYFPPSPYEVAFLSTAHTPEVLGTVLEGLEAKSS